MDILWFLLYVLITIKVCLAQVSITVTTIFTHSTRTVTQSASEIFQSPTLPPSTTFSTAIIPATTLPTTFTTSEPPDATFWSGLNILPTTDSLGRSFTTSWWAVFSLGGTSALSVPITPTSVLSSQTPSQTSNPSASTLTTPSPTSTPTSVSGKKSIPWGAIIIPLVLTFSAVIIWFIRRTVRKKRGGDISEPKEKTSHRGWPFSRLGRTSQGNNEPQRPVISYPQPIMMHTMSERSASPPSCPRRPASLSNSLMEDMQISPTLRPATHITDSAIDNPTVAEDAHRSFSPEPLRVNKNARASDPFGPDLESSNGMPWSATSSVYSTLPGGPGPSVPQPTYQPYRRPESPLSRLTDGVHLFPSDLPKRRASSRIGIHVDMDEDDPRVRRIRRLEAAKMLEGVEEATEPNATAKVSDGDEDEVKSEGSYDFAAARARKVLADKRMKEEYEKSQGKDRKDDDDDAAPPIPDYNPARANWK